MRRTTTALGTALLVSGFFLLVISLSEPTQAYPVMDGPVTIHDNTPYLTFQGGYPGIGSGGLTIVGNLQSSSCCVGFYLFTYGAYNAWLANDFEVTNSSTSPVVYLPHSVVTSASRAPAHFSHDLPIGGYFLVFFNDNRSLWNSNSNATSQVVATISIDHPPETLSPAIYPAVFLIVLGAAALAGWLRRSMLRPLGRTRVLAILVVLLSVGFVVWSLAPYFSYTDCSGGCPAAMVRLGSVQCSSSAGLCSFTLRNYEPYGYPYNDTYTEGTGTISFDGKSSTLQCPVVPLMGGGVNSTVVCAIGAGAPPAGTSYTAVVTVSYPPSPSFAGNFT